MAEVSHLHPTLWRTCRVIANRTRLRILEILFQEPDQTVSAIAARLRRPASITSEYLRALEARGLLAVRRVGPRTTYGPKTIKAEGHAPLLVASLRSGFQKEARPVATFFKLATAFTHPRRIEIFRTLKSEPKTLNQIKIATRISHRALRRHLEKLQSRGFIRSRCGIYTVINPSAPFGRKLGRLASESTPG